MLDKLVKHLIQEMGTSGPSGLDLDSLLHHAAQFYHNDQQQQQQLQQQDGSSSFASSSRPTTRIDDQYLRFLWKILVEQEGVIVGRVVTTSKPRPSSAAERPIPPALSSTIVEENEDEEEPDEGISSSKGKGKEKQVSAPPKDDDDDDGEGSQLDSHGLPSRKKIKGALPGMKGKATAKKNSNKGDLFVVLEPEEYLGVKLDDLKEKYDGLRIALDGNKMFYVLTGKHPGHIKISEIIYQALSLIASTKEVGLDSIALGRHLHQDQKMVFYYTKSLLDLGLIAKFQVTAHASFTTNLVHVLYIDKNQEQIAYALLKENKQSSLYADPQNPFLDFPASMWNNSEAIVQRIVDGLNLRSRELIRTRFIAKDMGFRGHLPFGLRRSIQRTIRLMVEKGIVRRVKIQNINQDPNGRTGRQHRAIQLVQRSRTSSGPKMKAVDEENEEVVDDMDEEEEEGEGEGDAAAEEAEERAMEEEEEEMEKEQEASGSGGLVPEVEMASGEEEELVDGGELLGVSEEEAVPSTTLFKPAVEVSTSMPIERQIVQMVADSGSHGMTFTQISDKIKVTRRFLDTFVDRHCSRASAPPHLSHLNLVAVTDFLGKEKNLVVYTIENWLENCRKTGIPSDEVGYPSPAPQARGFLDLEPYQLWTKEATRGQWADSYIAGKIPGIKPWVQARGGSVRGRGPQSRQGLERRAMVPRGPHVQVARKSTGGPKTSKKAAKEAVKDDGPPVVDPAFLLNSKMKPLSEIPKDEDGKYIFTRIKKGKGPGPPIIALLHQVFNGEVPTPQGKGKLEKLVRGANYYGIRIPDLVDDNYGEGIEVEMPEPLEGGPSKRKADEMKDESVAADGEDEEDAQSVLKKRKGPLQALDEDEDEIDSNEAPSGNARAPTRTNIIPATPPPAPEDDEEIDELADDDGEMEPAAAVERIASASPGLVNAPNDQLDVNPSQPPSQPNLALPRLQSPLEDLVEVVIEVSKSPSPAPVPLPAPPPPPPASKKRGPRPSTRTRASQIQDEEEEIASDLVAEAGPSSQKRIRYYQSEEPEEPEEKEEEEEEKEVVSKKAKGKQASRPYGKKIVAPRETRPKSNLDFARQKRDQYFLQWLKTEGGIFENSFNAPIVHQKYLEKIIAEAFAQGNDLRTKATLQDRRTWELTMGRLEEKQQIKTKTIAAETKSGEMMKTKIFYLFDTPQEELTKFVEDIAQNGPTSSRTRKPDPANPQPKKQRQEAVDVVELDIGYEAHTLTTLRKLRESQLVAGLTMDDVLEVIDDDEEVRKLFLFEWRTASQQYGFVTGAFARAAIFHKELARILEEGSSDPAVVVSSEQRVLSLVDVIAELSLEIFLKLVSLSAPDEVLTLLLENEEGRQTKMRDVPKALRVSLMVDRRNTKEKFQRMIQTFYYFKLAIPLHPAAATNDVELEIATEDDEEPLKFTKDLTVSFTHFQLLGQAAPLYALGNEKPTLTEVAPIGTTAEIGQFWTRMEELALNKSDAPVDPLPPSFADWPAKCDYPNRKSVSQPRSWLESYLLSPIQRAFLLRAVELSSDESPADDPAEIQRLSYLTAAPLDVVDTFVTSHIRKARRKQQQVEEIALKAEQRKKAKVEKETRTKLAAKRAEHRMQLEEDWSALARKYLGHHSIEMTDQLEKDLRGLRETELKDTTISRLNEAHIAEVVQEMLDTSPELRPQPGQAQSKVKGKGKAAATPKIKSATPGEVEEIEEVPAELEDDDEDEEEAMNERDPSTSPIPEPPPPPPKNRRRKAGGRRATTTDGQPPARSQSRSVDGRTVSPKKEEKPQALPRPKVPCYPVTAEDDYLIPNIGQGALEPTPEPGRRRARLNYTEELDDLILDLGAILIARSTRVGCRLIWKSVSKVLPAILPTSIRVRFLKLREDPMTAAYLLRLQDAYIHLWKTHRKTEVLPDPTRHKFEEFDIVHHLKFFRKNISKEELRSNVFGAASVIRTTADPGRIGVPVPPLPSSVEDLATWNLRGVKSIKNYEYEDEWLWLHDRKKQVSEEQNEKRMCGLQFVIDRTEPEVLDPLPPADWIAADPEMSTLAAALKMALSCPEAIYDAEVAQTILVQQPRHHNILGKVTRALLNSSLITKRDFHTMSRSHHLNQQITKIDGPLSNKFFSESAKVEDQGGEEAILLEEETSNWPFTASEGSTAALLSLCSENRVELNVDRDDVSALTQRGVYNTRKLEDNEIELHVYGRISNPPVEEPEAVAPAPGDLEVSPAEYTDEEREEALLEVQDSPSIDVSEGALAFQESLEAAGEGGLNWEQLFALDNFEPPLNAARIVKLARAFCSSSPPLAFWTGYDQARLVSSAYVRTWSVVIPPPPSNLVEMPPRSPSRPEDWEDDLQAPGAIDENQNQDEDDGEMDEEGDRSGSAPPRKAVSELREGEGTLVYPKRWLDLKGEIIPSSWEKSVRCVLGWIMARPTSEHHLRSSLATTFDRPEVTDILRFLLEEGIISRTLVEGMDAGRGERADAFFKIGDDAGEVGWLSTEQEKRIFFGVVEGRWLEGF